MKIALSICKAKLEISEKFSAMAIYEIQPDKVP